MKSQKPQGIRGLEPANTLLIVKSINIGELKQLLKLQESIHGVESMQYAKALCNLASAHEAVGELQNAAGCYIKALQITDKNGDSLRSEEIRESLLKIKQNLTGAPTEQDEESLRISSARIPVFQQESQALNPSQEMAIPEQARSEHQTPPPASASALLEELKEAESRDHLGEAIVAARAEVARMRRLMGNHSTQVADALVELADLYSRQKMTDEMEDVLLEALRIRETSLGRDHMTVSIDLKNLGRLYYATERFEMAEAVLIRALEMREASLGLYHPQVADIAELYSRILKKTGRDLEASEMDQQVEESRSRHTSEWETFRRSAQKAMEVENYYEAQAMWLAAMEEASDFEPEDPRIITTLENLAEVYWKRGKYDKAEPLCKRILQMSEFVLGEEHIDVALAANNLALLCQRQGKYNEAVTYFRKALAIKEKLLGKDNPDVIATTESLEEAQDELKQQIEAKASKRNKLFHQ